MTLNQKDIQVLITATKKSQKVNYCTYHICKSTDNKFLYFIYLENDII